MITRTYGQLHFSDLEPGRFEMLSMLIIYRMRRWERLDHVGAGGSDNGIDISAVELLENGKRATYHFQCKRYEKLTKKQLERIVNEYVEKNPSPADFYYVVCGCNPSRAALDGFDTACRKAGIKNCSIWSASYIETLLYSDYHDILFAYFGINLSAKRNDTIKALRRNIALKKKMHVDFEKEDLSVVDLHEIRDNGDYSRKFIHSEVLVRSIYDNKYPENSPDMPGYFKAEIYNWYHNGLEVRAYPYVINAVIRQPKDNAEIGSKDPDDYYVEECRLEVFGCIPFDSIIDYDIDGDEYYNYPHLFCDYPCGSHPFEEIRYRNQTGYEVRDEDILEIK